MLSGFHPGSVLILKSHSGLGRTTVLRHVHNAMGGGFLAMRQLVKSMTGRQPWALEEAFLDTLARAVAAHNTVIVDDLHLLTAVVGAGENSRTFLLDAALTTALADAAIDRKTLIFGVADTAPWPIERRAYSLQLPACTPADCRVLCQSCLGEEAAARLDYARIYRFAPVLNARQIRAACARLLRAPAFDTLRFVEYLQSETPAPAEIHEPQPVDCNDLKHPESIVRALQETNRTVRRCD
jgi:hypothetical protein